MSATLRFYPALLACGWMMLFACPTPGAAGDAKQEIYLWQRQWTPAVVAALGSVESDVRAVHVLAAEVRWKAGREEVFRSSPDYAALKKLRIGVGLVVRIGPYEGAFSERDDVASRLAALMAERVKAARAAGIEPVEVQVDFDCAESKLAGYRNWLRAFRGSVGTARLVFTALPAWLKHTREFRELAQEADGFVLQVHSLEKPRDVRAPLVLCEPVQAKAWAARAALVGKPFRVALPTYGYEVGFASSGGFVGLAADGSRRSWHAGAQVRVVETDAVAMQALASELITAPPANCLGIVWFRLPVEGDRLNWDLRTLLAVMRGETLAGGLSVHVTWSAQEPGLAEIIIENTAPLTRPLPQSLTVTWRGKSRASAADSLNQYALVLNAGMCEARFARRGGDEAGLKPGRRMQVGWMRFSHETSLHVTLSDEAASP